MSAVHVETTRPSEQDGGSRAGAPPSGTGARLLGLQRAAGNRAVVSLLGQHSRDGGPGDDALDQQATDPRQLIGALAFGSGGGVPNDAAPSSPKVQRRATTSGLLGGTAARVIPNGVTACRHSGGLLVQRDILADWLTETTPQGGLPAPPRPAETTNLDKKIRSYNKRLRDHPNDLLALRTRLRNVRTAANQVDATRFGTGPADTAVKDRLVLLKRTVESRLRSLGQRISGGVDLSTVSTRMAGTPTLVAAGLSPTDYAALKALVPDGDQSFACDDVARRVDIFISYQTLRELYQPVQSKLTELTGAQARINAAPAHEQKLLERSIVEARFMSYAAGKQQEKGRRELQHAADARNSLVDAGDRYGGRTAAEIGAALQSATNAQQVIDTIFTQLRQPGLIVAEVHGSPDARNFVRNNVGALSNKNVSKLYLEHFRVDDHQAHLDAFNATGNMDPRFASFVDRLDGLQPNAAPGTGSLRMLMNAAQGAGWKIMAADHSAASRIGKTTMTERARLMNVAAAAIISKDIGASGDKYVYIVGEAHAKDHAYEGDRDTAGVSKLLGAAAITVNSAGTQGTLISGQREDAGSDPFTSWMADSFSANRNNKMLKDLDDRVADLIKDRRNMQPANQMWRAQDVLFSLDELSTHGFTELADKRQALRTFTLSYLERMESAFMNDKTIPKAKKIAWLSYITHSGSAAPYVTRLRMSFDAFDPAAENIVQVGPRGRGGMVKLSSYRRERADQVLRNAPLLIRHRQAGIQSPGITPKLAKKKIAEAGRAKLTGDAHEADTYAGKNPDTSNNPVDEVVQPRNIAGVTVNVQYNRTDPNLQARLDMIADALTRVQAVTSVPIRPFNLILPKFQWELTTTKAAPKLVDIHVTEKSSRAEFIWPDSMLLSPGALDAKVVQGVSASVLAEIKATSKRQLEALRGVPTIVHEIAHMVHFQNGRRKFVDLGKSSLSGIMSDGTSRAEAVTNRVSQYGASNPRETVAEILTGIVFGRQYDREIMQLYHALNGPALR